MQRELMLVIMLFLLKAFTADAFVWPNLVNQEHARNCQRESVNLGSLREHHMIPNRDDPTIYQADKVLDQFDLNGDGICEIYVRNTVTSGTGGYVEGIFQKKGEKYELIADLFGFDLQLAEKKNGYYQLVYNEVIYLETGVKTARKSLREYKGHKFVKVNTQALKAEAEKQNTDDEWPRGSAQDTRIKESERLAVEDVRLNEVYKKLLSAFYANTTSKIAKEHLVNAQRAWIKFRDANCAMNGELRGGVPSWKLAKAANCLTNMTIQRTIELNDLLEDCCQ